MPMIYNLVTAAQEWLAARVAAGPAAAGEGGTAGEGGVDPAHAHTYSSSHANTAAVTPPHFCVQCCAPLSLTPPSPTPTRPKPRHHHHQHTQVASTLMLRRRSGVRRRRRHEQQHALTAHLSLWKHSWLGRRHMTQVCGWGRGERGVCV
jgi:hypothetical protein